MLGAEALLRSSPSIAQAAPPSSEQPDPAETSVHLLRNLFTRVGAAVTIDGRGPFTFVIDTGAGSTAIADTVAAQLGLADLGPILVHGITTASVTRSVAVNRMTLNGLTFRDLRCPVLPRDQLGADGLLGLDALGRFKLSFDVLQRTASLTIPGVTIVTGSTASIGSRLQRQGVPSHRGRFGQLIMSRTSIDGVSTQAFIDSGAQYSIGNQVLRRAVSARARDGGRVARPVPLYGVTGQRLSADLLQVDDLRLGGKRLGRTPLLFADLHCFAAMGLADEPTLLVGADLLSRFRRVTIDFPRTSIALDGLRRQSTRTIDELTGGLR